MPVAVMMEGEIIAMGDFDTIRADARVKAAYFGKSFQAMTAAHA